MSGYEMTKAQNTYLNTLVCQRVSDDKKNKDIIQEFFNSRNPRLTEALQKSWSADKEDRVAYYLITDPQDDMPLLFFSLKCGEMHIPLDPKQLDKSIDYARMMLNAASGWIAEDWAREIIEKKKVDGELPEEVWDELYKRFDNSLAQKKEYEAELQREGANIIRTKKNFAAVELVHFCVHEPARERWAEMGMGPQTIGKTMFWHFVEPLIRQIRDLVGCEYIYLFAADPEKDGTLTKYYQELGFEFRENINVNKPRYDFCCYFMCQKVTSLQEGKRAFLKSYNKPKAPVAV